MCAAAAAASRSLLMLLAMAGVRLCRVSLSHMRDTSLVALVNLSMILLLLSLIAVYDKPFLRNLA